MEAEYLLPTNTLLSSNVEYLDAVYYSYSYLYPNLGAPPITGCPFGLTATGASFEVNCGGRTPPQSPRWSTNIGVRQTIPVGSGSIVATLDTHFQTATLTGLEFSALEVQPSYWLTNATLGYQAPKGRWSITGYVNNLSDRTVVAGTFPNPLTAPGSA